LHRVFHGIRLLRLKRNYVYREINIIQTPLSNTDIFSVMLMVQKKGA
jgi:hypothetical protein